MPDDKGFLCGLGVLSGLILKDNHKDREDLQEKQYAVKSGNVWDVPDFSVMLGGIFDHKRG